GSDGQDGGGGGGDSGDGDDSDDSDDNDDSGGGGGGGGGDSGDGDECPEGETCDGDGKIIELLEQILGSLNNTGEVTEFDPANASSFFETEYEDGFAGIWDEKSEQLKNTDAALFIKQFRYTGNGSMPNTQMCFNLGQNMNFGCLDVPLPDANVMAFIRIVILISAAFLCRAIVFGG
ncbi:hypothetical protein, partial [Pseudoalteromonas amylolytica]|uniref:hypothetical protein n=2 Tax=Pseudoalteromonas TaxID=53246 RepID=UPI001980B898